MKPGEDRELLARFRAFAAKEWTCQKTLVEPLGNH